MVTMLARHSLSLQRIFPEIRPDIFADSNPETACDSEEKPAHIVFDLAGMKLSWAKRVLGLSLNAEERLIRLLRLYRQAFEAELQGSFNRADFFWKEFLYYLKRLWPDQAVWIFACKVAKHPGELSVDNVDMFRNSLLEEVFIDTHIGFYNGCVNGASEIQPDDRAFIHTEYLAILVDLARYSSDIAITLLAPPIHLKIQAYRALNLWSDAIRVCDKALERFPNSKDFQEILAGLYWENALSGLKNREVEGAYLADAKRLQKSINKIESCRRKFPFNPEFYRVLGQCYYIRAIKLANGNRLSDALAAIRWAQKYDPYLEKAYETEEQLKKMMDDLRVHVMKLQAEVASHPGVQLTEQGQRMVRESKRGFTPLEEVEASTNAAEVLSDFHRAQAREVWLEIGLREPEDKWDEQASNLLRALGGIVANPPSQQEEIEQVWETVADGDAQLAVLDCHAITSFLRRRLFGERAMAEPHAVAPIDNAPVLVSQPVRARDIEPLGFWLFSRQGLAVKLQALAAMVLLSYASFSSFDEYRNRQVREVAYQNLAKAVTTGEEEQTLRAAENFLAARVHGTDGREADVRRKYDRAFTYWFIARGLDTNQDIGARVDRYQTLAGKTLGEKP